MGVGHTCILLFLLLASVSACERPPEERPPVSPAVARARPSDFEADSIAVVLGRDRADTLRLPPSRFTDSLLLTLEYREGESAVGVEFDLNGDRLPDWIIRSASRLCGTGGCPLSVVMQDATGRLRVIGDEFASAAYVMRRSEGGWSVLWVFSSGGRGHHSIGRLVYDGSRYEFVATADLDQAAYAAWHTTLSKPFGVY